MKSMPTPVELTEILMQAVPQKYPVDGAIQGTSGLLIELLARRYPTLDMQIAFTRKLFEMLELGLRRRDMLGRRISEIEADLKQQGKPHGQAAVLVVLQQEIRDAAAAPQTRQ